MKSLVVFITVAFCLFMQDVEACTSVIISGKVTPDGRPLMWKHRYGDAVQSYGFFQ